MAVELRAQQTATARALTSTDDDTHPIEAGALADRLTGLEIDQGAIDSPDSRHKEPDPTGVTVRRGKRRNGSSSTRILVRGCPAPGNGRAEAICLSRE